MEIADIECALEEIFDQAIVFHGFTDYMRDYQIIVYATADPRTGIQPQHLGYLFTHCIRATVTSAVRPDIWARSLDDRLVDYEQGVDLDGYVWGVKWQCHYPGAKLLPSSEEADRWAQALGVPFHEVVIEANCHNISLVFSDLRVETIEPGYTTFATPNDGPDGKIYLSPR